MKKFETVVLKLVRDYLEKEENTIITMELSTLILSSALCKNTSRRELMTHHQETNAKCLHVYGKHEVKISLMDSSVKIAKEQSGPRKLQSNQSY